MNHAHIIRFEKPRWPPRAQLKVPARGRVTDNFGVLASTLLPPPLMRNVRNHRGPRASTTGRSRLVESFGGALLSLNGLE